MVPNEMSFYTMDFIGYMVWQNGYLVNICWDFSYLYLAVTLGSASYFTLRQDDIWPEKQKDHSSLRPIYQKLIFKDNRTEKSYMRATTTAVMLSSTSVEKNSTSKRPRMAKNCPEILPPNQQILQILVNSIPADLRIHFNKRAQLRKFCGFFCHSEVSKHLPCQTEFVPHHP